MTALNDPSLLKQECLAGGSWRSSSSGKTLEVRNPANGILVSKVPSLSAEEVRDAIGYAEGAMQAWKARPASFRADLLSRWHDLIRAHAGDLASIVTAEQGKPLAESLAETAYGADFVRWFAGETMRISGDALPSSTGEKRILVQKEPVGVCAAITPWNFPIAMVTRKVAPALAAGCAIIVKPAPQTPLSCLALAELALRAGLPSGMFSVVTGDADVIGPVLTDDTRIRKLSFTGSTAVGKRLIARCADTVKRVTMELGGNAPFLVFADADLEEALSGLVATKFRASGQTCISPNRILVEESVSKEFASKLSDIVRTLRVGAGMEPEVQLGPLIDGKALEKVERLVADALSKGASLLAGGKRHSLGGTFYEPTVLTGCTPDMDLWHEEIFGPVAALFTFRCEEEAVTMANDSRAGLASYLYTRDIGRIRRLSDQLECGMIGINTGSISDAAAPFGGIKESGYGREGSRYGINDYLSLKYLCLGGLGD